MTTTTLERPSSGDGTTAEDDGRLDVSTKLMEGYQIVAPVDGGADLSTFLNDSGFLDVYSVGTAAEVYRFRPQSDQESGWDQEPLGIQAQQVFAYPGYAEGGLSDRNNPNLMGVGADDQLTLSTFNPATSSYEQVVTHPAGDDRKIKRFLAVQGYLGRVYVNVILEDDTVANNWLNIDGTWSGDEWVPIKQRGGSDQDAKAKIIAMSANSAQDALFGIDDTDEVVWSERTRFSYWVPLNKKARALAVVEDKEKRLSIFAVDLDGRLWQKRQKKYPKTSIEWMDWIEVGASAGPALETAPLLSVRAVTNAHEELEIFGIGEDDQLHHTRETGIGPRDNMTWGTLFPLGNQIPNSIFAVGQNSGGYSEAYSVTHDNRLYQFWQDPHTTAWANYRVQIQPTGEIVSMPSHSVELTAHDASNLTIPGAKMNIATSALTSLKVNGLSYVVSEHHSIDVEAPSDGRVVIERGTNTLSGPTLLVSAEFMDDGTAVTIESNAALLDTMSKTTTDDVWDAKDTSGEYLLQGDNRTRENAKALADATRLLIGHFEPAYTGGRYLEGNALQIGTRHIADVGLGSPYRLSPELLEGSRFVIDFSGDAPEARTLSEQEAAARLTELRAAISAQNGAEIDLGIHWGDVWDAIKNGIAEVVEFVVDGATAVLKFIINGVEMVFEGAIEFAQQALGFIEAIWAKVEVFFEKLWEWLGFLFDWPDILRTAEAIEHSFNETTDFLIIAARNTRELIAQGFDTIEEVIQGAVDDFVEKLDPNQNVGQYGKEHDKPDPRLQTSSDHNVMLNKFMANYDKGDDVDLWSDRGEDDPINGIVEKLEELANNFELGAGKEAFDEAIAYFSAIGESRDNILNLLMAGMVRLGEAILLWGIAAAKGVVLTIFDLMVDLVQALKDAVNAEWTIPVVSELYKLITGQDLTFRPIAIFSIIVAIPTTALYKIMKGKAPLPSDNSLAEFKRFYTAELLASRAGFSDEEEAAVLSRAEITNVEEQNRVVASLFGVGYASAYAVRIPVELAHIALTQTGDVPVKLKLTYVGLRYLNSVFSIPWALDSSAGAPSCATEDTKGFGNTIWICQIIFGPTRGLIVIPTPAVVSQLSVTIWGAAHLGMVIAHTIAQDDPDTGKVVQDVLTCLGPQLFQIAANQKVAAITKEVSPAALGVWNFFTYMLIAKLACDRVGAEVPAKALERGA